MEEPFWKDGLRFGCTRCSRCCTGEPGYVFLSTSDLRRLMTFLDLDFAGFYSRYCRFVDMGEHHSLSLKEKRDHSCILWGEEGCTVYEARPVQCSTYPFWSSIVASSENWAEEGKSCPGIGEGRTWTAREIGDAIVARRAAGLIRVDRERAKRPELLDEAEILGR